MFTYVLRGNLILFSFFIINMHLHLHLHLHLQPLTGTVKGVPFISSPRQRCLSSAVGSRVSRSRCVHSCMLSSQFFLWRPCPLLPPGCHLLPSRVSSLALQGALQDGVCNGVVSSDVAKPGEFASFHCCQQGLLLSSKGVHLLSHVFVCLVFSI